MAVPLCFRILINTEFIILIFFIGNCHDIMHGDSGFVHSKIRPGGLDPSPSESESDYSKYPPAVEKRSNSKIEESTSLIAGIHGVFPKP